MREYFLKRPSDSCLKRATYLSLRLRVACGFTECATKLFSLRGNWITGYTRYLSKNEITPQILNISIKIVFDVNKCPPM